MKEKNIKGLDNDFYYEEQLDTTFVLTGFKTEETMSNVVYYEFTPVYGLYEDKYYLPVAYFESFNDKLCDYRIFRLNNIHDIFYSFEQE